MSLMVIFLISSLGG